MKHSKKRVRARVVSIRELDLAKREKMYRLLQSYYHGVSWEQFQSDLTEKNDVILLEHRDDGICGFSTLLQKEIEIGGRKVIGVFSGDTILEQKYWGSPALGIRFLGYLWGLKLKNLGTPVYWFLISKGYKTYLLMANNFKTSFPDLRRATPHFEKSLMDRFYSAKYGAHYQPERGVISFAGTETCRLKEQIAPITEELRQSVPRVAFFVKSNPNWAAGDELACIAKMTLDMPVRYAIKKLILPRSRKKAHSSSVRGVSARAPLPAGYERRISVVRKGAQFRSGSHG